MMKKKIYTVCAALLLASVMTGCGTGDGAEASTAPLVEPATVPDLTDTREPSDAAISAYEERLSAAFADTAPVSAESLTYTEADGGITVTGYTGGEPVAVIPDAIGDLPVVAIAPEAFAGQGSLRAVYLPDSVRTVGKGAFHGCNSLATLRTPVITAGEDTPFFGSLFGADSYTLHAAEIPSSLTTLILGDAVTVIPDYAFYDCELSCIALPDTLTEIGAFAFYGCTELGYVGGLSDTALVTVGERAFANCAALLTLDLPATVTSVGLGMLEGCGTLERLTLPFVGGSATEHTYLGYLFGAASYTFTEGYVPASLLSVELLPGCDAIPDNAFFDCSTVRAISVPDGVRTVGRRAFYGCERLQSLSLPDSVTSIGDDALHGCIRMQSVTLGSGLADIGIQAFMSCLSLTEVSLPSSVTALPASCFAGCISLVRVTAPGVTAQESVGLYTYRGCERLTDAPFLPVEPETDAQ